MMIDKNTTTYSIVGSLSVHMLFTLVAGSFLLNINTNIQPTKTYKLEFVKKKNPPPIKKKDIRKEPVRQEIKVASLTPKTIPVLQPKAAVQQTRKAFFPTPSPMARSMTVKKHNSSVIKSAVIYKSSPSLRKRMNAPVRSFALTDSTSKSVKGVKKVAMVQGIKHFKTRELPKRVVESVGSLSSRATEGRVPLMQTGVKLAALRSFPKPRGIPNIVDKGVLKNYMVQVQQSVEGAKRYPEASRRAGRQGKLKVQFTILKNGEVDNVRLLTETPYPNLNREAVAAVKRAAPFSGFPDIIMKQSLKVILPFRFELN